MVEFQAALRIGYLESHPSASFAWSFRWIEIAPSIKWGDGTWVG